MTREDLENKGWKLWEAVGKNSTYTKGDPYSAECIWLNFSLSRMPNVEVRYKDKLLMTGWFITATADDLHAILSKIAWLK